MLKVNLLLKDGSNLKEVILFKNKNEIDSRLETAAEIYGELEKNEGRIHFLGKCSQGEFFVNQVFTFDVLEETVSIEDKIKKLVSDTSSIYDLTDTPEWIMYNKEALLRILQ